MHLADSTFLITGASSGLGAACARLFHEAGARIVLADVDRDSGQALAQQLGPFAEFITADVASADDVAAAVALAGDRFDRLDGVVNCAGILAAARIVGRDGPHDLEMFTRVIQINLIGTFNVMRLAAEAMSNNPPREDGERGVIINTSSVAAFEGQIGQAAYSASKGGVAAITLPAARELARFGIRVVAIAPGVFATPMMQAAPPHLVDALEAQTVFPHRLGEPAEFAALARQIVENPMLNGDVIRLDGAVRMAAK